MASPEAELPIEGESTQLDVAGGSNGNGQLKHSRRASLDGSEPLSARTNSPLPSLPLLSIPRKRRAVSLAPKHDTDERKSSDTVSSRLSSLSTSSTGATASSSTAPTEPETSSKPEPSSKNDKMADRAAHSQANEENSISNGKERTRRTGYRRLSPRRHLSPHPRPNALDYIVQDPEDPTRNVNNHHPNAPPAWPVRDGRLGSRSSSHNGRPRPNDLSIDGALGVPFSPIQPHQPNFPPNMFGSPEIPYSGADAVVFSPIQPPPFPMQQQPNHSQLERLPLSGYELLAAKLSGRVSGPKLPPIYRRFETLHHRLLLHMQDELAELEEQLHSLDAADTQSRWTHGGIHPASRRQEKLMSPGEVTWQKQGIISQVAQKLYQYNQVITSFKSTQDLAEAPVSEILGYRHYLSACNALVDDEARFVTAADDLVTLARRRRRLHHDPPDDRASGFPPPPLSSRGSEVGSTRSFHRPSGRTEHAHQAPHLSRLVLTMAAMILIPVVCFAVIPSFVGRMTVVLLVGLSVATALLQSGALLAEDRSSLDCAICAGVYGGVMAVIAGAFS